MIKRINRSLLFFAPLLIFCVLATSCSSQKTDDTENKKPAQSIEELQEKLENVLKDTNIPGLSVAIVHKDGPKWIAGLGKADVANGRVATADTLFRIGSVSKAFASLAVLKLADQGKLSLEDPVRKLAPEVWFENRWETDHPVRIVNLLEHTTGWDDTSLREYAYKAPNINLSDALDFDHSTRISRWPPGTRMAYCNSGPAVAAFVVEKITGMKFEDYVEQNFFKPLGMKTATYFQPAAELTTSLYHLDGKTPYPYWDFIYRPTGSINASANDMANYLHFYINRGNVNGIEILKASDLDRMENPASTWAAKEGLKAGYGLGNYWRIHDGFVYHGHDGGMDGGLTVMEYIPDEGVGFYYSINSSNGEALNKIGTVIRAYLTRGLIKPAIPAIAPLPENAIEYTGWYRPDSPRVKFTYFLERLLLANVHFKDDKMLVSSLGEMNAEYLHVIDSQFRYVSKTEAPEPAATVKLLTPNVEGKYIQMGTGMLTKKRIPTWLAIFEIATVGFVALSMLSILVYAPFWIIGGLIKKQGHPAERGMRIWPLVAVLSLIGFISLMIFSKEDIISRFGILSVWSTSVYLATIAFAAASIASVIALWRTPKEGVRSSVRGYSSIVTTALVITAIYFAYWGLIGLSTWT